MPPFPRNITIRSNSRLQRFWERGTQYIFNSANTSDLTSFLRGKTAWPFFLSSFPPPIPSPCRHRRACPPTFLAVAFSVPPLRSKMRFHAAKRKNGKATLNMCTITMEKLFREPMRDSPPTRYGKYYFWKSREISTDSKRRELFFEPVNISIDSKRNELLLKPLNLSIDSRRKISITTETFHRFGTGKNYFQLKFSIDSRLKILFSKISKL